MLRGESIIHGDQWQVQSFGDIHTQLMMRFQVAQGEPPSMKEHHDRAAWARGPEIIETQRCLASAAFEGKITHDGQVVEHRRPGKPHLQGDCTRVRYLQQFQSCKWRGIEQIQKSTRVRAE